MITVTVSAANLTLYHVAAAYLDDATQWWRIVQANGMSDPDFSSLTVPVETNIPAQDFSLDTGLQ